MENRRRHKWDNNNNNNYYRRSHSRKPPRGSCSWQPTVPSWEKEFCRVIGSLGWETLLHMKKFTHLYEDVIKWDDSAGEEAFSNAKKRFWAEINGLPCGISIPSPDLYIDEIDWDSGTDSKPQPDLEQETVATEIDNDHDPVVIFGDSLLPNESYTPTGWGDEDENFKVAAANSSSANHGSPWAENWGSSFDNGPGWPGESSTGWHVDGNGPGEYTTWGDGWNTDWGWKYPDNNMIYDVQPHIEQGQQSGVEDGPGGREWNSYNSYVPANHHATITVGQTWNQ